MEKTTQPASETNSGRVCSNCKHLATTAIPELVHVCRRFPPMPVGGIVPLENGLQVVADARFPRIHQPRDIWCGEFQPVLN